MIALSTNLWISIALLVAWLGYLLLRHTHIRSFRDVIRLPGARKLIERSFAQTQEERKQASTWKTARIRRKVDKFVWRCHSEDSDLEQQLGQQPEAAANRAAAILLEANDRDLLKPRAAKTGDYPPQTPVERICTLLSEHPVAAAAPRLRQLVQSPDAQIRKSAARPFAALAEEQDAEDLVRLLGDLEQDEEKTYVATATLDGIETADEAGRVTPATRDKLFSPALALVGSLLCSPLGMLWRWDPERTIRELTARGMLTPDHKHYAATLEGLQFAGHQLDRETLLQHWHGPWPDPEERDTIQSREAILRMLGAHGDERDNALLEQVMTTIGDPCSGEAATALIARLGFGNWDRKMNRRRFRSSTQLTDTERRLAAMTDFEVGRSNGGLDQYFWNPSGDDWPLAIEAFQQVGDSQRATLLQDAVARFQQPPSRDCDDRCEQLAAISQDNEAFEDLEQRKVDLPIEVVTARFLMRHEEELRAVWNY